MRDLETIEMAITAAETGHIVFGTLHTTGAQGTVDRIIDVFPTNQQQQIRTQLAASIIAVLSQALLPQKPKGLVAAYELLVVTPAIANLIREGKTYRINSSIQTGKKYGMQLLDDALFHLWNTDLCEESDVLMKSVDPASLRKKIIVTKGDFDDEEAELIEEPFESPADPPQRQNEAKPSPTSAGEDESDLDTLRSIVQQLKAK